MKAWIDRYGDVVWHDSETAKTEWTGFLNDGCRLRIYDQNYYNCEQCIGTWMICQLSNASSSNQISPSQQQAHFTVQDHMVTI